MTKNKKYGFSRDEMMHEIRNNTEVGREFVKVEMAFLRAIKTGELNKILCIHPKK